MGDEVICGDCAHIGEVGDFELGSGYYRCPECGHVGEGSDFPVWDPDGDDEVAP